METRLVDAEYVREALLRRPVIVIGALVVAVQVDQLGQRWIRNGIQVDLCKNVLILTLCKFNRLVLVAQGTRDLLT